MVVFSGCPEPTVKTPVLPTIVWTVLTSVCPRRKASSEAVAWLVDSRVEPECIARFMVIVPLSLFGAKLKVILGTRRKTTRTRTIPVETRTTTLLSIRPTRDLAYASLTHSSPASVQPWRVVVRAWEKARRMRPR